MTVTPKQRRHWLQTALRPNTTHSRLMTKVREHKQTSLQNVLPTDLDRDVDCGLQRSQRVYAARLLSKSRSRRNEAMYTNELCTRYRCTLAVLWQLLPITRAVVHSGVYCIRAEQP